NAAITNSVGHTSLQAGRDLLVNASVSNSADAMTLDLLAGRNLVMADGTQLSSSNGDIRAEATSGDLVTELLNAGTANIALLAGNRLSDRDGDSLITASGLILKAGTAAGSSSNVLNTNIDLISAQVGSEGLFLTETNDLTIGALSVAAQRVDSSAQNDALSAISTTQEDLNSLDNGAVIVTVTAGDLTLNGGTDEAGLTATGSGNVRLQTLSGNLNLNAGLNAGSGHISLLAEGAVSQSTIGDLSTTVGDIDLQATGNVGMADGATSTTTDGNIRYAVSGDLTLGGLSSNTGDISLIANSISDAGSDEIDLSAQQLRVSITGAAGGFGSGDNAIETAVGTLSAQSGSAGFFLLESDALTITELAAITTQHVNADGTAADSNTDAVLSDLVSQGALVLET
ncbi:hypothetical protein, partial [Oceanospirillum sanctuarii]|uniref:hypothetical protein n=1 Tax=Oceanospirillum sanctuarii TaxID=1434821 RepID=UPI0015940C0C